MNILKVYYLEKLKLKLYENDIVLELIELVILISEFFIWCIYLIFTRGYTSTTVRNRVNYAIESIDRMYVFS